MGQGRPQRGSSARVLPEATAKIKGSPAGVHRWIAPGPSRPGRRDANHGKPPRKAPREELAAGVVAPSQSEHASSERFGPGAAETRTHLHQRELERRLLSAEAMSRVPTRLARSLFHVGARLRDTFLLLALLAGCSDAATNCPSPQCPDCSCDAEVAAEALDDLLNDSEHGCASLSASACERSAQCMLQASCAAPSICRGNNCSDACDVVTSCVESR